MHSFNFYQTKSKIPQIYVVYLCPMLQIVESKVLDRTYCVLDLKNEC